MRRQEGKQGCHYVDTTFTEESFAFAQVIF